MSESPTPGLLAAQAQGGARRGAFAVWAGAARDVLRRQAWLIAVMGGYIALGMAIGRWHGQTIKVTLYNEIVSQLFISFALTAFCVHTFRLLRRHRPKRPLAFLTRDLLTNYLTPHRILTPLPVLLLTSPFISVVSSVKRLIAFMNPFDWDARFAELDRLLHGGIHPWELLHPLLAHPYVTAAVSELYSFPWFFAVALLQFWLIFTRHEARHRLILTNLLCWILLGNLAATLFSSAGPVYYAHFVPGPDPYAELMAHLAGINAIIPLSALESQDYLWSMYQSGQVLPGTGISAMPSMHLSMATLMVLAARHIGRRTTILAWAYLVFLQLGSVYLGWHYAIDGYASTAATFTIWWALGRLGGRRRARRDDERPTSRAEASQV